MRLGDEIRNAAYVTAAYALSFAMVTWIVAPIQRLFIPEVSLFAALIFLPHGVRVLSAWMFGWRSVLYLFFASTVAHYLLTPHLPLGAKAFAAWAIASSCAALAFALLRAIGRDYQSIHSEPNPRTWRGLLLVGFVSSALNSLGHNLLFAGEIFPVGTWKVFFAFLAGDTIGTFACFAALMLLMRALRRMA